MGGKNTAELKAPHNPFSETTTLRKRGLILNGVFCSVAPKPQDIKFVFKPRSAQVDCAIMELFEKMNQLPKESKSLEGALLPIYKILDLEDEDVSIHEFISGEKVTLPDTANRAVSMIEGEMPHARTNFNYLEAICRSIGLTDLHSNNILIKDGLIFLIDLESINRQTETGLLGGITRGPFSGEADTPYPTFELTQEEKALISEFNHKIDDGSLVHRYVPIATVFWQPCFSSEETLNEVLGDLKKAITVSGYTIEESSFEQINEKIRKDIRIGDIPYFTKKGNVIRCGKFVLAKVKEEEKDK